MKSKITLFIFIILASTLLKAQTLDLELFASGFSRPVSIKHAGDNRLFIMEQDGLIKILNADGSAQSTPFLDIDNRVINTGNERGLLGLAFHPDYANNGFFYVNYINNAGNTEISRFTRDVTNPNIADPNSELPIISFDQPFSNHNGGDLAFGLDGYLYIATGDGGSGGDPQNNAQNPQNLLGNLLRIDIDSFTATENYTIPANNPFIGDTNFRPEIFAYGLRNPWKFSFDRLTNDLWIADVGQNQYEEINMVSSAEAALGLNYGWRCYEGNGPFNTDNCADSSAYTFPIEGYFHSGDGASKCSITGGYSYRGVQYPNFTGWYFFADICSQEIGYLIYDETTMTWNKTFQQFSGQWSAFGEDINGELYVADLSGGNIYKIIDTTLSTGNQLWSPITIYPNPTKDQVRINFGSDAIIEHEVIITIIDLHGKPVKKVSSNRQNIQNINTSALSNGVYVLKIHSENRLQSTHKLVIQ